MKKEQKKSASLQDFAYTLPLSLIAKAPLSPRDASRLFVYNTKTDTITFDTFRHIGKYLPPKTMLVFNTTKVLPARLYVKKETGGVAEVLLLINEARERGCIKAIADRKLAVGQRVFITPLLWFHIERQEEQYFFLKPNFKEVELPLVLSKYGVTPLPPYIKDTPLTESEARRKYQSVLAKEAGSVAAPTASLHFTPRVLTSLAKCGVKKAEVTLHVGMGTFAPVSDAQVLERKLFKERYVVGKSDARAIEQALRDGYTIIPVGTTATRVLESVAREGKLGAASGETDIFIAPPYQFKVLGGLVTNFHVPESSLMMLVEAVLQSKGAQRSVLDLYRVAMKEGFRFYSFGDAMLII